MAGRIAPGTGARRHRAALAAVAILAAGCAADSPPEMRLSVRLLDPAWTGGTIPAGQQCRAEGGRGTLPGLRVAGLPDSARVIEVAVNDLDDPALAEDGGHGIIGFEHRVGGPVAILPPVPGETAALPDGIAVVADSRAGDAAGYLPPCSGGAGHVYEARITALDAEDRPVGRGRIRLGRY